MPIRALYTVPEMASAAGLTQQSLRRLLSRNGVQFEHSGRRDYVPLIEIEKKVPWLWDSLKAALSLKGAVEA